MGATGYFVIKVTINPILYLIFGEGNGIPLLYSCLENPMDGGAWRAAVYGVAQSRTQLKQLSSSSSRFRSYEVVIFHFIHRKAEKADLLVRFQAPASFIKTKTTPA